MHAVAFLRYFKGKDAFYRRARGEVASYALNGGWGRALRDTDGHRIAGDDQQVSPFDFLRPYFVRGVPEQYLHSFKSWMVVCDVFPVKRFDAARLEGHLSDYYAVGDGYRRISLEVKVWDGVDDEIASVFNG